MGRLIFLTYFYLIASLIHIVLIGLIQFRCTKLLKNYHKLLIVRSKFDMIFKSNLPLFGEVFLLLNSLIN